MRLLPLKAFCLLGAAAALLLALPATSARATQTRPIPPLRDISVVISPPLGTPRVGSLLTLRVEVTNGGPERNPPSLESLYMRLPQKAVLVDISGAGSTSVSPMGDQFFYTLPELEPGESTPLLVTIKPLAPGLLIFEPFMFITRATNDPNPFNNSFTQYVWVEP